MRWVQRERISYRFKMRGRSMCVITETIDYFWHFRSIYSFCPQGDPSLSLSLPPCFLHLFTCNSSGYWQSSVVATYSRLLLSSYIHELKKMFTKILWKRFNIRLQGEFLVPEVGERAKRGTHTKVSSINQVSGKRWVRENSRCLNRKLFSFTTSPESVVHLKSV
jgi:hypothetical protein